MKWRRNNDARKLKWLQVEKWKRKNHINFLLTSIIRVSNGMIIRVRVMSTTARPEMRDFDDGRILRKTTGHRWAGLWWFQHINTLNIRPSEDYKLINFVLHRNGAFRWTILRSKRANLCQRNGRFPEVQGVKNSFISDVSLGHEADPTPNKLISRIHRHWLRHGKQKCLQNKSRKLSDKSYDFLKKNVLNFRHNFLVVT